MKLSIKVAIIVFLGNLLTITAALFISVYGANLSRFISQLNPGVIIVIVVLSLLFTCLVWLAIVKLVIFPINSLTQTTKIISLGNLGKRVEVETDDEIGELAKNIQSLIGNLTSALQSMANSLKETRKKEDKLTAMVADLEDARKITLQAMNELSVEKSKVEQSKATDEALLSSIGDGVIATDASGKIIFMNVDAKKILYLENQDLSGKNYLEVIAALDFKTKEKLSDPDQIVRQVLTKSQKVAGRYYLNRADNTTFPVAVTASSVVINNQISGSIVIFRDITQETEIDRMKTEFISLASHQLRTPLSAIRWFAELLGDEDQKLTVDQQDLVKNIYDSTLRMVELVDSLLNISRIESGRIIIDPVLTDIVELAKSVITEIQVKVNEKKHKLVISTHEALPQVNLDPRLIRQVFLNLLTNAIKYTPENGEIVVFISKKDDQVIIQISDNGLGIPKASQHKMFQKFFRAENAIKTETNGNGLGLYLVKSIIESSKGKIWFESEEGKGSTFWFSLPIAGVPAQSGEVTLDG